MSPASPRVRAARASCQAARRSGLPVAGSGPIGVLGVGVAGDLAVDADRGGLALPVQAGGGVVRGPPRAATAHGRLLAAACSAAPGGVARARLVGGRREPDESTATRTH